MVNIHAEIGTQRYKTTITTPTNTLIADEPATSGGGDLGFNPYELLAAALGACTSATLRMYADNKGWPLEGVQVDVSFERNVTAGSSAFKRDISFTGNLTEEQVQRLLDIANKCPVHRILTSPITVETHLRR